MPCPIIDKNRKFDEWVGRGQRPRYPGFLHQRVDGDFNAA